MNPTSGFIYNVFEWITRFAYLNLLWILFSLAGGIIFGFFPATIAMFAITREWLKGNTEKPILKAFWEYYRRDFLKSNLLGIFISIIIFLITIDIIYIQSNTNGDLTWTYIPLFAFMLLFIMLLFYIFPAFVHYDIKVQYVMKNSFFIMLINPFNSLLIILCLVPLFFIMKGFPALAFIFGGSSYAYITMWISLHAFNKTNKKNGNPVNIEN
ncbi:MULTISPECIES: YesL family protein [Sporosarcina]|uniref:Membrane protein YesL n=1 Tax=Sporosarcina psychrophila TaxID=1476 RepID=A0ABV2K9J0_SPOPS|nr:YesL family protein [Sporosarcina sp. resist]QNK90242.1 YesL family protein [Sporosarcina sp. resist]